MDRRALKRIAEILVSIVLMAAAFFISAGTLDAPRAWLLLAIYILYLLCNFVIFFRISPEIVAERSEIKPGTKPWEKAFAAVYIFFMFAIPAVAGLDLRLNWSYLGMDCLIAGIVLFTFGFALTSWAIVSNRFFELTVSSQAGHKVATGGPYTFIRHPGYVGMMIFYGATPLIFGSAVSLIPAALLAAAVIWRTALEDATLQKELKGYKEYAKKVRYRLVPGIW
jgi:protein-S-isoprenylcysteine O-methyltransferase Ste14